MLNLLQSNNNWEVAGKEQPFSTELDLNLGCVRYHHLSLGGAVGEPFAREPSTLLLLVLVLLLLVLLLLVLLLLVVLLILLWYGFPQVLLYLAINTATPAPKKLISTFHIAFSQLVRILPCRGDGVGNTDPGPGGKEVAQAFLLILPLLRCCRWVGRLLRSPWGGVASCILQPHPRAPVEMIVFCCFLTNISSLIIHLAASLPPALDGNIRIVSVYM